MAFLKGLDVNRIKVMVGTGIKTAQENMSNINVNDMVQGAKDAASTGMSAVGKAIDNVKKKEDETPEEKAPRKELTSLLWCMAYIDGEISIEEKATLEELSGSIDENYSNYAEELGKEYGEKLTKASKEFGHRSAVKIEAQKLVESLELSPTEAKLLCWNLIALANADGLDESETDLVRFIGETAGVETAVIEELRNYSDAIAEIESSIERLKESNRSYGEIEPFVSDYVKRQQNLLEAAQSLISDR